MPRLLLVALAVCCCPALGAPPAGYRLVWGDEFDGDGPPDPAKWDYERGFVRNQELQWYRPENAERRDGVLVLTGRRERVPNPGHDPASRSWRRRRPEAEYTSACLISRGKFAWQYGVLEVRARLDARPGLWPAIWTLGERGRWPACGEVDVMEFYQGDLLANACWPAPRDPAGGDAPGLRREGRVMWDAVRRPLSDFGGPDWSAAWHTWRMDWDAQRVRLSIDGALVNEIDTTTVPTPADGPHPFRQPHYLLLNLAIGGTQGGDPSATAFPAAFEVDYVRVYQRDADAPDNEP